MKNENMNPVLIKFTSTQIKQIEDYIEQEGTQLNGKPFKRTDIVRQAVEFLIVSKLKYKFKNISCSQCGEEFGPGNSGFSHCEDHKLVRPE